MTLEERDKEALVKYKIERSEDAIREAKVLINNNELFGSVNRIYYACFYSTEVLFLTKDRFFSSHERLIGTFNKEFTHSDQLFLVQPKLCRVNRGI